MFYLAGVGLSFFLTLLLLSKKNKSIADVILNFWLLAMTLHLLLFYLWHQGLYPQLLGIEMPFPLLHGPFLYLYSRSLTNKTLPALKASLHFAPALLVMLYMINFLLLPTEQKVEVYRNKGAGYEIFNVIRLYAIIASGILYFLLSSLVLRAHRRAILNEFSTTRKVSLQWLQYLIYWIGIIWLCVIFRNDLWTFTAVVLFILFIGFFGIRQVGIFSNQVTEDVPTQETEKRKYQKSGLTPELSESIHNSLIQIMNEQSLFRQNELSLTELAQRLNTLPNHLSQVINEREGKNFYDYINTLRVEEFKRMATGPESKKYSLLGLAQECGFNSKSSFNRYFKKVTGKSPSEYFGH